MAGLKLLTKLDAQTCLKLAWRTAQDFGYSLSPLEECSKRFTASKGNVLISFLTGPIAPHCDFLITAESYPSANEVVLEMNRPWFTSGAAGVKRVRARAEELLSAIACAIEKDGGTILERRDF